MPILNLVKQGLVRALRAAGYTLVRIPAGKSPADLTARGAAPVGAALFAAAAPDLVTAAPRVSTADRFAEIDALLKLVAPWSGQVPEGYVADFLGILTDGTFLWNRKGPFPAHPLTTSLPTLETYGEAWFEVADWFYSVREARGAYVAISLGAAFGAQLVGAWKVLQAINPLPARLVAVEPVPKNCEWTRKHFAVNGIDPDRHWILEAALGVDNEPVLFPVGAPGTGLTASAYTNSPQARSSYAEILADGRGAARALKNILLYNSTGLTHELGLGYEGELKFVSAVTLRDVLAPFERVDLLEVDIQQAEVQVIAPCMHAVNRKVRRVHIGTHGREVHDTLRHLFAAAAWEIVFDYGPDTRHMTERGPLTIGDGILTARNPKV